MHASWWMNRPVATINAVRPGASAHFAGPQLATPLVPARRRQSSGSSVASDLDALFGPSPLRQTPSPVNTNANANASLNPSTGASVNNSRVSPIGAAPPRLPVFQMQTTDTLFPTTEITAPAPNASTSARLASYDNLFSPHDMPRPTTTSAPNPSTMATPSPPVRSTQSFSYPPVDASPQLHAPPPAAPFLGYADPNRVQSFRTPTPGRINPQIVSPVRSPASFSQQVSPVIAPPVPRIHVEVRSADDLLEEFLRGPNDDPFCLVSMVAPPKKLTLADVPDTLEALEDLYRQKRWKTLTKKSLAMLQHPLNDPQQTLEIKSWWLAGLIKEGHYDNATSVLDQIGTLDNLEIVPRANMSFVTVRLRLLDAMLSKCKGNAVDHERKLFELCNALKQAIASKQGQQAAQKWLRIAQFALVNHLVNQNKFTLALRVSSTIEMTNLASIESITVLSRLGRVYLQMGDLAGAEELFQLAKSQAESAPECHDAQGNLRIHLQERLLLNDGLLLFAKNSLQDALNAFDAVVNLESTRAKADPFSASPPVGEDDSMFTEEDLVCVAVNNFAICALYCCDVGGAVTALERVIRANPTRFLNGVVVFNLSSLYDLIYDNATSTSRKEMMKKLAEMYDLEHIDAASFRI